MSGLSYLVVYFYKNWNERDKVGNTIKEKEVMNGNISNTHNIIEEEGKVRNPYNMNIEKDKVITANTKITEGYDTSTSSVMKEEDKVNETSNSSFVWICNHKGVIMFILFQFLFLLLAISGMI
jgi:hypothetical protein